MAIANRRCSKYTKEVRNCLSSLQHATNAQIIEYCRRLYPEVSSTTVHRITQRMLCDGEVSLAPSTLKGEKRYDINVWPHDHFRCTVCDHLRDLVDATPYRDAANVGLKGCQLDGPIVISGKCDKCVK